MNQSLREPIVGTRISRRRERESRVDLDLQPERSVRLATPDDFQNLLDLCQQLHSENGQHALSWPKVARMLVRGIERQYAALPVIGEPGDIRAMLLLFIDEVYYSDERQIVELWNFVRSDSRRSPYGRQLLEFAMQFSDITGMHLTTGIVSNVSLEAKIRMYERVLGKSGGVFIYRPSEKALTDGR